MSLVKWLQRRAKMTLAPILYRHYPIGLQPRRFYLWLDCLRKTEGLAGAVLEVGIASGGTAAFSRNFLRKADDKRSYVCIDTFDGFVREQFEEDVALGNSWSHFRQFGASPVSLVRRVLQLHGANDITLIESDISKVKPEQLPEKVSVCLLDVDLAVPIYDGLKLIWPRLESGGMIVVDDCYEDNAGDWQALKGLNKFSAETGVTPEFYYGAAKLTK